MSELVIPDQLRSAVTVPCRYEPGVQRTYEDWARHYGTAILPARQRKPRDKAKVEVGVQVAQRWILARLRNETFFSLEALNERIAELLEDLNRRPMKTYGGLSRRDLFERLDRAALKSLPDELVRVRPVLCYGYAFASMACGENESVEPRLQEAERWLDMGERSESPPAGMVVADKEEFRRLPGLIALTRGGQALGRGDTTETKKYAQRVLDLASEGDHLCSVEQPRNSDSSHGRTAISISRVRRHGVAYETDRLAIQLD